MAPEKFQETDALERELRHTLKGEVRFDNGSRALYATDASNYRMVPIGACIPKDREDVIATIQIANKFGAPILMRGAGTSLAGQCCNWAVVLDLSKYVNRIVELDPVAKRARVEPGLVLDDLRNAAEKHHLTFGPDPATHKWCTLGGMIGNNSCGVHSIMSGRTSDNIESLEILTYDGARFNVGPTSDELYEEIINTGGRRAEIYQNLRALRDKYSDAIRTGFPKLPRRVSGFNLEELLPENGFNVARALVGTEGTCVAILEATTQLIHSPSSRVLVVLAFSDIYVAADHVPLIMSFGPIGLEGFDSNFMSDVHRKKLHLEDVAMLPEGGGWFLVEFGGETVEEATISANKLLEHLRTLEAAPNATFFFDPNDQRRIWRVRESGLPATSSTGDDKENHEGWEDAAVPPEKLGAYLRDFRDLLLKYDYHWALYGHFGHGCVHTRLTFDLRTESGIAKWRNYLFEAAALVVKYGGSLSGEHGDGQSRAELLPIMYGPELMNAFREFKTIWDPQNKMNPGKIVEPFRVDEHLRFGPGYEPWQPLTVFQYPNDRGSFVQATERCVGAGLCRRSDGGTMCPSFMATHEEQHSTRGRSRLLFEMMRGEVLEPNWKSEPVKAALDLCLACKGCKSDCPVNVDIATYKSEFLSHYYKGRMRPRAAYAMGLVYQWSKLGSRIPALANFFTSNGLTSPLFKLLGGVSPKRSIPKFAKQTFRKWFFERALPKNGELKAILWADTFNDNFHPEIAQAACEVLEHCGVEVIVLKKKYCCGRPLYDWGMLDKAKVLLQEILDGIGEYLATDTPIVVLEPSCASVFRDELCNLYPNDPRAKKLASQTYLLSEYLLKFISPENLPALRGKAQLHGHCHHKAIMKLGAEEQVLRATGLDLETLDTGCCGMAGAFGFETKHYNISKAIAELTLLPALRKASTDSLIITDGFSCREQIEQLSETKPLHLAEVLRRGIRN
jgi:FAD/FMN-containing dehydrogenase/Fe-S oxidoreductase